MSIQGSIFWMAPEVVRNKGYSAKVDIWSLGCVVVEMLTGQRPWIRFNELAAMYKLGQYNAPPIPGTLSEDAIDFLKLCFAPYNYCFEEVNNLVRQPEDRPTATTLLAHPFILAGKEEDVRQYLIANANSEQHCIRELKIR